jgi:DNA-directed RNA polymerase subunit H (RpoH/RPB5)
MNTTSDRISSIYKSRNIILELLKKQGYDVTEYQDFSVNEIDAMYSSQQLNMFLTNPKNNKKVGIVYYIYSKALRNQIIDEFLNEYFYIDDKLSKKDDLIIICDDDQNDNIMNKVKYLYEHDEIFINIFNIKRLQFNILEHDIVPESRVLNDDETSELKIKYNLKNLKQLPEISRFDPQAQAMSIRPGEVCEFKRKSVSSLTTNYYRICV